MSDHESRSNIVEKISPQLALVMIEEGFAIKADNNIYQRNPGLHYFNFRKWRQSENYTIQSQNRNKVYLIKQHEEPIIYTREEVLEKITGSEIIVIPPKGQQYKPAQLTQIYIDMRRMIKTISNFIN